MVPYGFGGYEPGLDIEYLFVQGQVVICNLMLHTSTFIVQHYLKCPPRNVLKYQQ